MDWTFHTINRIIFCNRWALWVQIKAQQRISQRASAGMATLALIVLAGRWLIRNLWPCLHSMYLHKEFVCSSVQQFSQESPRQTKPKKGSKRKVHEFRPFLWILVFFLGETSTIHIELLFRNAPAKSSWTDLSLVWFAGATPDSLSFSRCTPNLQISKQWLSQKLSFHVQFQDKLLRSRRFRGRKILSSGTSRSFCQISLAIWPLWGKVAAIAICDFGALRVGSPKHTLSERRPRCPPLSWFVTPLAPYRGPKISKKLQ